MLKKELNILMIDDHHIIIEGYKRVLETNKEYKHRILKANTCDQAVRIIKNTKHSTPFDLIFIDIQLPASSDGLFVSGEDLAILINKEFPMTKIVILTMIDTPNKLLNIIKTIPHNGLLVKSDITSKILLDAFNKIVNNSTYYSKTVLKIKSIGTNDELLDEYHKKIIYHLANGVLTKNLVDYIPLSLSAIEKRKNYIKQLFDVIGDDEKLLTEAKKRGYL